MSRRIAVLAFVLVCACNVEPRAPSLAPIAEPARAFASAVAWLRAVDDVDASFEQDGFRYYAKRDVAGARVWCRRAVDGGDEQELLHERELHGSIGALAVSPDQRSLAYSSRPLAVDRYAVHVKDLATGDPVAPIVEGADFSFAWNSEGTLFYTKLDDAGRPARVYAMKPRSAHVPKLVHEEREPEREVMVGAGATGPAMFVRNHTSLLAYRLDPLHDLEPPRVVDEVLPDPPAPSGGAHLDDDDAAPRYPTVR